jgi:hypothetical protein
VKWRAHAIALGLWAIPPICLGVISEINARGQWIDLGSTFTIAFVIAMWLVVAVPTTVVIALRRTADTRFVVLVHVVTAFLAVMINWFMQG